MTFQQFPHLRRKNVQNQKIWRKLQCKSSKNRLAESEISLGSQKQTAATRWVEAQKRLLAQSNLRQVMHNVRLLFPRDAPLPDPVLKAVTYLFRNRWRMCYREFRAAGCPIGSGTVESACKLVVQQRMKQSGMRWSRHGAQAMLALRSALLSDRWDIVERSISTA